MNSRKIEGTYTSVSHRSGIVYSYGIHVPDYPEDTEFAVLVTHDGLLEEEAHVMDRLSASGEVPPCVVIGIVSGRLHPTSPEGKERALRLQDYDFFSPDFADFVVDEFIPYIKKTYGLLLSDDPNMHMMSGGSSGAIAAWNGVWFRNDYFRRAYLSSPSFLAMNRGNMAPVFIRLYETKPIRVFMEYSENEPDEYFGSSYCVGLEAQRALEYAGYDYVCKYYPGEGHCSRYRDEKTAEEMMRFLWKDWEKQPIKIKRLSNRAELVISTDEPWELTGEAFPEKMEAITAIGKYSVDGENVIFSSGDEAKKVAEDYQHITAVAVSSDLWRLYLADSSRGCLYAASICEDGSLKDWMTLVSLHMATDFQVPGAFDICVDANDRIFAATELGIQCVRSFGLIDVILPLPGNAVPKRVAFGGEGMQYLYADCGDQIFRRKMKTPGKLNHLEPSEPKFVSYYD